MKARIIGSVFLSYYFSSASLWIATVYGDDCVDIDPSCSFYAAAGECNDSNWKWMFANCRKSCNACGKMKSSTTSKNDRKKKIESSQHSGDSSRSESQSETCYDIKHLQSRINDAYGPRGVKNHHSMASLYGIVDDVLSLKECQMLLDILNPSAFAEGAGAGYGGSAINTPKSYLGLGLEDLSNISNLSQQNYTTILDIRHRVLEASEQVFGLCPNSLEIDYTYWTEKTAGGKHAPHADNCFVTDHGMAQCDTRVEHPYPQRIAASILYLNEGFGGGEFYLADHDTREAKLVVQPKPGRLIVFTAGPESLHGALPVADKRRLALGMWYNDAKAKMAEAVPKQSGLSKDEL